MNIFIVIKSSVKYKAFIGAFAVETNAIRIARECHEEDKVSIFDVYRLEVGAKYENVLQPIYTTEGDDIPW